MGTGCFGTTHPRRGAPGPALCSAPVRYSCPAAAPLRRGRHPPWKSPWQPIPDSSPTQPATPRPAVPGWGLPRVLGCCRRPQGKCPGAGPALPRHTQPPRPPAERCAAPCGGFCVLSFSGCAGSQLFLLQFIQGQCRPAAGTGQQHEQQVRPEGKPGHAHSG